MSETIQEKIARQRAARLNVQQQVAAHEVARLQRVAAHAEAVAQNASANVNRMLEKGRVGDAPLEPLFGEMYRNLGARNVQRRAEQRIKDVLRKAKR